MKKILNLLLLLLIVGACDNKDEVDVVLKNNKTLDINTSFICLQEDSTGLAGNLEIFSTSSQVDLKWNLPAGANIDTTLTTFSVTNGKYILPIKWDKKGDDGLYGPKLKGYDAGVLVSADDVSQYVHLLWADKVDSTQFVNKPVIQTRASVELEEPIVIELTPEIAQMDEVVGKEVYVSFSGINVISINQANIPANTNIDKTKIPSLMFKPDIINFVWKDKAPEFDFIHSVFYSTNNFSVEGKVSYSVQTEEGTIWNFVDSSPIEGGLLPASNATVQVRANSNKPWRIECADSDNSPARDNGSIIPNIRTLVLGINENTSTESRTIVVNVIAPSGKEGKTLVFTQLGKGQSGTFDFLGSNPVDGANIPGFASDLDITVSTDMPWYIKCGCAVPDRVDFGAEALSTQTKTFTISANDRDQNRIVTVEVGIKTPTGEDVVKKELRFIQAAYSDPDGGTLIYQNANLPVGNIPVVGNTYTFIFTGTYTGGVQVRALIDGVAQAEGTSVTNKQPQCLVSVNSSTTTRNITFEYKRADGNWTALPPSTNRVQDANNGGDTGNDIVANTVLPTGDLSEYGQSCYCTFTGGPGKVIFRARKNGNINAIAQSEEYDVTPSTSATLAVNIPALQNEKDAVITFEYSTDGGNTWKLITTRKQVNESIGVNIDGPVPKIAAKNGSIVFSVVGNYSRPITIYARYRGNIVGQATAPRAPQQLVVPINDNTSGVSRELDFSWVRSSDGKTYTIGKITQLGQ